MDLLLLTQYFDVLNDVKGRSIRGGNGNAACVSPEAERPSASLFIYHMPETVTHLTETARKCFGSTTNAAEEENLLEL